MDIAEYDSYAEVKPLWEELNRTYKNGELAFDWQIHNEIFESYHKPKGYKLKFIVGFEETNIGIFPFKYLPNNNPDETICEYGEDALISREYLCMPENIHKFIPYLPKHLADDLSCFVVPAHPHYFKKRKGGIIDLKNTEKDYFDSLTSKHRYLLKRNCKENSHIIVEIDDKIREAETAELAKKYIQYWVDKNIANGKSAIIDSREKINIDLLLMRRSQELGKLIALYFYLDNKLAAVNFAVRRESDRVDDYLCLRDTDKQYAHLGLGVFAVLKNIEFCRSIGVKYYDLSDFADDYKRKFINTEMYYFTLGETESGIIGIISEDEQPDAESYPETQRALFSLA